MVLKVSPIPRSTPLGRRAGLIGVGLLVAGFNTGNNLFYLCFTLLAASELVGFLAAGMVLRRMRIELVVPRRARVGAPVRTTLRLTNPSRWLPLPGLSWKLASEHGEGEVVTPGLAPGATGTATGRLSPTRRGWLRLDRIEVRTDFPFGLSQRVARARTTETRTLVLPRPLAGRRGAARKRTGDHQVPTHPRGSGDEPIDAREYRTGDDARGIDWKATARTDRLVWRERRGEPPRAVEGRLDRAGPPGPEFGMRVSRAAGAAQDALSRGVAVAFVTDECDLPPRHGLVQYRRVLEYLAVVEASGDRRRS